MVANPAKRVAVIGPGRLGTLMAVALRRSGYRIAAIAGGSEFSRQRLATTLGGTHTYALMADAVASAELVVLAVPDRALEPVVRELAKADVLSAAHQVIHLSGSYGCAVLSVAAHAGAVVAAIHPAVSVPNLVTDPDVLVNAAWALTSSPAHRDFAAELIADLGGTAYVVAENRRVLYHAALTLASNATGAAIVTARRLLAAAGIDVPELFLTELALSSIHNAVRDGVAGVSGPVVRGDMDTVARHATAIGADVPNVAKAYAAFTAGIVHTVITANPTVDAPMLLAHVGEEPLPSEPVVLTTRVALDAALASHRRQGRRIVLVPTMGALHAGHLALVREAHRHGAVVVVSVFVNPTQFDNADDLAAYPRMLAQDVAQLVALGAAAPAFIFAPEVQEVYPRGALRTSVVVDGLTDTLCGAYRPGHFVGVATVVTKLFALVGCDVAVFGQKDFQQTAVIRQLVADLNLPVEIVVAPTVREAGGLALSSRNERLDTQQRTVALQLSRALALAALAARTARGDVPVAACVQAATAALADTGVVLEYLTAVDPVTLAPLTETGPLVLLAIAGHVGEVRLIDNVLLDDKTNEQRLIDAVFGDAGVPAL